MKTVVDPVGNDTSYGINDAQYNTVGLLDDANGFVIERVTCTPYGVARHHWAGDLDGDGAVTSADQAIGVAAADSKVGDPAYNVDADLNRDGVVTSDDFPPAPTPRAALRSGYISNAAPASGPDNPIGYAGYVFNPETLLSTVRFRTYDPEMGRWLERDPAGYVDGASLYQYIRGNALAGQDPSGLMLAPTPDNFFDDYPEEKRNDWIRQFYADYMELIKAAAQRNCVPAELLAAVIANEMLDYNWRESLGEKAGFGRSLGPAQITWETLVREGIVPGWDQLNQDGVMTQGECEEFEREILKDPVTNIELAARLLKHYLGILCDDFENGCITYQTMGSLGIVQSHLEALCSSDGTCDDIAAMDVGQGLMAATAAMWNNGPKILRVQNPAISSPNAVKHAQNCSRFDGLLDPDAPPPPPPPFNNHWRWGPRY